jgi:serine protease Do
MTLERTKTIAWLIPLLAAHVAAVSACAQERLGGLRPLALLDGMVPDAGELDLRRTPVVRAVERSADSVVSIYVLLGEDLPAAPRPEAIDGQGSGVIIDESGFVITNWHVVANVAASPRRFVIDVRLKSGKGYRAELVSSSPDDDLALLQLRLPPGERVVPVQAGDSDSLMVGETVIAIGNPQGHANTVTVGVLSAKDRSIVVQTPDLRRRAYKGLLQTDAAINQGNSGGALLDITGKLIGINNAMAAMAENIGFAIPVNTVKHVFRDVLLSSENLASVWIGFRVLDDDGQTRVTELTPFGPAERAGLRVGDVLVEFAGHRVANAIDYARAVIGARPGAPVDIVVQRGGQRVTVRPVPLAPVAWEIVRRVGLELEEITYQADRELVQAATSAFFEGMRGRSRGVLPVALRITHVHTDSPAAELGFEVGDVLVTLRSWDPFYGMRNVVLRCLEALADNLRASAGGEVNVLVLRGERTLEGRLYVRRV